MIAVLVIAGGVSGAILGVELTKGAEALIQRAANKAQKNKHAQLSSLHIADALFDSEQEAKGGLGTRVGKAWHRQGSGSSRMFSQLLFGLVIDIAKSVASRCNRLLRRRKCPCRSCRSPWTVP